jgi:hypothetical protein
MLGPKERIAQINVHIRYNEAECQRQQKADNDAPGGDLAGGTLL